MSIFHRSVNTLQVIYKFIKTGSGPWGRPLPQSLFPAIAKHVKMSGDSKVALKPIPDELLKEIAVQDKAAFERMESDLRQKGVLPE